MADKCATPVRDCPFDAETIRTFGAMESQVKEIHTMLVNGNGLVKRVRELEDEASQRKGSMKAVRFGLVIVGVIPIAIEILRALKEIP
jgi:hypothetical protein